MKVLFILALSIAALAEDLPDVRKTENKLPYVGVEAGKGYQETFVSQPLTERLELVGLLYRTKNEQEHYESVGFIGPSVKLFELKGLQASLGGGLYARQNQPAGGAVFGEAAYESKCFAGDAVFIQSVRQAEKPGHHDQYLALYFGPKFKCWTGSYCSVAFSQDTVGHNCEKETLRGLRLSAPLGIKHTSWYVKLFTKSTLLLGLEFQPN